MTLVTQDGPSDAEGERTAVTRVLLVEDNPGDALLLERNLADSHLATFELRSANRLHDGLKLLETESFDIGIFDLSLPDSPPEQLDFLLAAHRIAPRLPIIVLTGQNDLELATEAVRKGAQDYLVKGQVDPGLLTRAIRYAIERQTAEEALRLSEERYALAMMGANDGVWDWNLHEDRFFASPRWRSIVGLDADAPIDCVQHWMDLVHVEDRERLLRTLEAHLEGKTEHFEAEYRIEHSDGNYRWVSSRGLAIREDDETAPHRMAGSLTDITDRKRTEDQLLHAALHDSLTGLPNRALFLDRLEHAIARHDRYPETTFAVLFLDLDRFKNVNDSLGHAVGDRLLVSIGRRLESLLRPSDRVARLGGDEFAILADDLDQVSDATRVADRLLRELAIPYDIEGHEIYASASVGITTSGAGYSSAHDMLRDADNAMYRAKSLGKARYQLFDPEMHTVAMEALELENDLRRALERGELKVHFQPIVDLVSGDIEGFEALVRWHHPERGLIMPDAFVPLAEETGLILQIGPLVLEQACRQVAIWQERYPSDKPLKISVNVSGREFVQQDLEDRIQETLARTKLAEGSLRLEITESMLMDNAEIAISRLERLREQNVQVHLDDFGTGYCSLSYLHQLPTDTLKIDRSFVHLVGTREQGREIIGAIVALARKLGMEVSAEGIETQDQVDHVRQLSCDYAQGFYFSGPLDAAEAELLLSKQLSESAN